MIYLALDTNIWIYLANGFNAKSSNYIENIHKEGHFKLLETLISYVKLEHFGILINDIILNELKRNESGFLELIKTLERENQKVEESFKTIKSYVTKEKIQQIEELKKEALITINDKIQKNKEHIINVGEFIKQYCIKIPINNDTLIKVGELAGFKNKAPFHSNKNNFPDALILFNTLDFLKHNTANFDNHAIFVSNNYKDFALDDNSDQFHPDIKNEIGDLRFEYRRHLSDAIVLGDELRREYQDFLEGYLDWNLEQKNIFLCKSEFCFSNDSYSHFGEFDTKIRLTEYYEEIIDPNQLNLFAQDELKSFENESTKIRAGKCNSCETLHIECPECSNLNILIDEHDVFYCSECLNYFKIATSKADQDLIIYKINPISN